MFYKRAAMWTAFLTGLGARVVISGPTTKKVLDAGIALAVDESCLPMKVFLGHMKQLVEQELDYIFVCRQQAFAKNEELCTKLWGVPDVCRNTFQLGPGCRWLELNISPAAEGMTEFRAWCKVGRYLSRNPLRIWAAYRRAVKAQARYEAWLHTGAPVMRALDLACAGQTPAATPPPNASAEREAPAALQIALLGHTYLIHDEHLGLPLIKLLRSFGAQVHIVEDFDKELCGALGREVSPRLRWTYNREILGAAELLRRRGIDGLIFIEAFPCGPDALVLDYAIRRMGSGASIMRIVLDELQSLTGIQTRIESFIDVIAMQRCEPANV
jgi:predicted nucleotide-binding protein (sugar kinase/HSP70/actin superfamily)